MHNIIRTAIRCQNAKWAKRLLFFQAGYCLNRHADILSKSVYEVPVLQFALGYRDRFPQIDGPLI